MRNRDVINRYHDICIFRNLPIVINFSREYHAGCKRTRREKDFDNVQGEEIGRLKGTTTKKQSYHYAIGMCLPIPASALRVRNFW